MLLTPQHRRSARVAARMQKTAQQEFNERVANGTMTKEELLNAPTCFRSFDEAEDAILAQSDEESEEEDEEDEPTRKDKTVSRGLCSYRRSTCFEINRIKVTCSSCFSYYTTAY